MGEVNLVESVRAALLDTLPDAITGAAYEVSDRFQSKPEELAHLGSATKSRRDEFSTGRHCLRQALFEFDEIDQAISLLPDDDGVPRFPIGYIGSISHSRGLCIAVAAQSMNYAYLGIDIEKTTRLSKLAMKRVVHSDEMNWVESDQTKASLLFSAKEAFYKAQFPRWRCIGNFHDLTLCITESFQQAEILTISNQFPYELRAQANYIKFRYRFIGDYVITLCFASNLGIS